MQGLAWTAAIWLVLAVAISAARSRLPNAKLLTSKENIALMIALLGTFSVAGQTDAAEVLRDPVILERVIRGGLSALSLAIALPILIARLRVGRRPGRLAMGALVAYTIVALVSTVYSAAPLVTVAKVFELSAGLVPVLAAVYGSEPRKRLTSMLQLLLLGLGALVVVGVFGFFLLPSVFAFTETRPGFVFRDTLFPPYAHSNAMSSLSALVGTYALARFLGRSADGRGWWAALTVAATLGVVLASGRQGVVMFLIGVSIVLWLMRRRLLLIALGPALGLLAWANWDVIFDALRRDRPDNLVTLTGRIGFWEAAVVTWSEHIWTGWGYGSGGRFVVLESIGRGGISSLHSGYFELLTGVGILGAIPLLYALFRVSRWSLGLLRTASDVAVGVLIVLLALRTGVSLGFGGWLTGELLIFAVLAALADEDLSSQPSAELRQAGRVPVNA